MLRAHRHSAIRGDQWTAESSAGAELPFNGGRQTAHTLGGIRRKHIIMFVCLVMWCLGVFVPGCREGDLEKHCMSRLTITLDDDLHRALKETAARQGRSIASIIAESLRLRGIRTQASARALVAQAQRRAELDPDDALRLAVEETRAARKR